MLSCRGYINGMLYNCLCKCEWKATLIWQCEINYLSFCPCVGEVTPCLGMGQILTTCEYKMECSLTSICEWNAPLCWPWVQYSLTSGLIALLGYSIAWAMWMGCHLVLIVLVKCFRDLARCMPYSSAPPRMNKMLFRLRYVNGIQPFVDACAK